LNDNQAARYPFGFDENPGLIDDFPRDGSIEFNRRFSRPKH
jgi:hypothetical protein